MNITDILTSHWGQLLAIWILTYFVYWDSKKNNIPYRNAWIIGTFLLPPVFAGYLLFKFTAAKKMKLTLRQKEEAVNRARMEEAKANLAKERTAWEEAKAKEMAENRLTEEQLEEMRRKRLEDKARRMEELAEERRLQEEEAAKTLKIKQ